MRKIGFISLMLLCVTSLSACSSEKNNLYDPELPPHIDQNGGNNSELEIYSKDKGVIRLVSYNVGVFSKYMENSTEMVADMMNEMKADAIAVNEVDYMNGRHPVDQLKVFARALGEWDYMYGKAIEYRNGYYGEGAVVKKSLNVKAKYEVPLPQGVGAEARVLVVIETEKFVMASTHLDHVSNEARIEQAKLITKTMKEKYGNTKKPVFLCGDLNSKPSSDPIEELKKDWTIISSTSATFPSTTPTSCIDYVMVLNNGASYKAIKTAVCRKFNSGSVEKASDHLPVFVDVQL